MQGPGRRPPDRARRDRAVHGGLGLDAAGCETYKQGSGACRGQGGDHLIARDVTALFTEGWDWMQPVRDRDTGIFDSVELKVRGIGFRV